MTEAVSTAAEEAAALKSLSTEEAMASAYVPPGERVLDPSLLDKKLIERMPQPTGWRLLVMPYKGKAVSDGGILLVNQTIEQNTITSTCAYVLKVGPLAYKDPKKFPDGPWCKEGQWVVFPRYAGSRFRIDGGEVRIINDDEVLGTIADPDDILSV